jgi:hypothetical protein
LCYFTRKSFSLQKEKTEKESLVYALLEDLHECTSEDTYTAVLLYIQDLENFISGVEDHGRRLKVGKPQVAFENYSISFLRRIA